MKGYKRMMIAFAALLVLFVFTKLATPAPTKWDKTLRDDDKNPYGTYILYKSIQKLFPNTSITEERMPVYNIVDDDGNISGEDTVNQLYIAVAPDLDFSKEESRSLLKFIGKGNYVFLASEANTNDLYDSLRVHAKYTYALDKTLDSARVNFADSTIRIAKGYSFYANTIDFYFDSLPNKYPFEKLGVIDQSNEVNFVKIPIGKGALYLHSSPIVFSNAFILQKSNYKYVEQALSYLPQNIRTIHWDGYYTKGRTDEEAETPFRYFLSHFWLRIGFYLAWILLILYVLFGGKRKQRIIPVLAPPRNTTADFINTISSLYYNQHSGPEIFEKKVYHWLAFIRNHLHMDTDDVANNEFWERLSQKTNIDLKFLLTIREQIIALQTNYNDNIFRELYKNIETFYTEVKK